MSALPRDPADPLSADEVLEIVDTRGSEPPQPPDPIRTCGLTSLTIGADVVDADRCLRRLAASLNGIDQLGREVIRARAIRELERAAVSPAARMVDAALARPAAAATDGAGQRGTAIALRDPEPWSEAVDGSELLAELARTYSRRLALPDGGATLLAVWTAAAHALDAAQVFPVLAVTSPEKACGKTTALTLLFALAPRPLFASNFSTATVFRVVDASAPTLLMDEADSFLRENKELRGVLNSGHYRAGAVVLRCVGEDFEARAFSTWCAKAVALIGALPDTLTSRSVVLQMRRATAGEAETLQPVRLDRLAELEPLRRRTWRWARDSGAALRAADPPMPAELRGRAADNWRPLLAVADLAGGPWPEQARRAAVLLSGRTDADEGAPRVLLLADLRDLFRERGVDRLPSEDVVAALRRMEDRPWPEWKREKPISVRQLARLLKPLGTKPRAIWWQDRTVRGYVLEDFADAFSRYLPPPDPQGPQEWRIGASSGATLIRKGGEGLADRESAENSRPDSTLADLADGDGGVRPEGDADPDVAEREGLRAGL